MNERMPGSASMQAEGAQRGETCYIRLSPHLFSACCHNSTEPVESLLLSVRNSDRFSSMFDDGSRSLKRLQSIMHFHNAYLFLRFHNLSDGDPSGLEWITDGINTRIDQCGTLQDATSMIPTMYNDYVKFYAVNISNSKDHSPIVQTVRSCLRERYNSGEGLQALSVGSLAEKLHVSEKYLSSRFIRETGCTLSAEINRLKIECAKQYLERTDFSMEVIAEKAGFCSYNYFARRFKASVGMSPMQYRAQVR